MLIRIVDHDQILYFLEYRVNEQYCLQKTSANLIASISVLISIKCAILEKRSTTTSIAMQLLDLVNPVIKSIDISFHGSCGGFDWHYNSIWLIMTRFRCLTFRT